MRGGGGGGGGGGKRARYLPFAVALDFPGISVNSILSVTRSLGVCTYVVYTYTIANRVPYTF